MARVALRNITKQFGALQIFQGLDLDVAETLLLFAGLRSLPRGIVEAARVDSLTPPQIVWRIYLPLLRPVIGIALILRIIMSFKLFDFIYVLAAGGPGVITENLAYFSYIQGFRYFNLGYACALSILQLIVVSALARLLIRFTQRSRLTP